MHVQEPFENTQWRKVEQIRTICISVIGDVVRVHVQVHLSRQACWHHQMFCGFASDTDSDSLSKVRTTFLSRSF